LPLYCDIACLFFRKSADIEEFFLIDTAILPVYWWKTGIDPVDIKTKRRMIAILEALRNSPKSQGSKAIASALALSGIEMSERAVRNYLAQADTLGWTVNLGRRGRRLTPEGLREIESALAVDKVGFIAAKVDALAYQMDFDPNRKKGRVVMNIATVSLRDAYPALKIVQDIFRAGLGMGSLACVALPGETIGTFTTPPHTMAIGTVCSVTINGILLKAGIVAHARFGGLLEVEQGTPKRFTQIITYDGSTLDPLEVFIRSHMTTVQHAASTGNGIIGAGFREIPAIALAEARRVARQAEQVGLGGILAFGHPNQPLLDVPVPHGRVGLALAGGLNPIAAVAEAGIPITGTAMSTLAPYEQLTDYRNLIGVAARLPR